MKVEILARETTAPSDGPKHCIACDKKLSPYLSHCPHCKGLLHGRFVGTPSDSDTKLATSTRIAHLTDLHVGKKNDGTRALEVVHAWLDALRPLGVDVVVISGDVVDRSDDHTNLLAVRTLLQRSGYAWAVVPGNHDVSAPGAHDPFQQIFGTYPRVERHRGVELLLVDSNVGLPLSDRSVAENIFRLFFCPTEGTVGEQQLNQLKAEASSGLPRLMVLHHHLARQLPEPVLKFIPWILDDTIGTMEALRDADVVREWAVQNGVKVVLHGHKHAMQRAGIHGGNLVVLNGGSSTKLCSRPDTTPRYLARLVDVAPDGSCVLLPVSLSV